MSCVAFFSLEMSSEQLATRISPSNRACLRQNPPGDITEDEFHPRSRDKASCSLPFYIDDTGGFRLRDCGPRPALKRQRGLGLLVVDYLQLLLGAQIRWENRVQEVTEITGTQGARQGARSSDHGLSQLSRQVEQREDKRPQLSDLRESGSIEQDADIVLFVFREEYYLKNRSLVPARRNTSLDDEDGARAWPGGSHNRQAATRANRHDRACLRSRGDPVRHDRAGGKFAGDALESVGFGGSQLSSPL